MLKQIILILSDPAAAGDNASHYGMIQHHTSSVFSVGMLILM